MLAQHRRIAGVEQHEAARAIGRLDVAAREARLTDRRGLLVADHAPDRDCATKQAGLAEHRGIVANLGEQAGGDPEQPQEVVVPLPLVDIVEQSARGVGGVGRVDPGQSPQQEAVDRPEGELAAIGAGAHAGDIVEDPAQLGRREIRVEQQPGARPDERFAAVLLELRAICGGAAVLPDDRVVDRLACRAVPHDDGLALVGDPDRRDRAAIGVGHAGQRRERIAPDILGIMLDPAGVRVILGEFAANRMARHAVGPEAHAAGRGCALVDRQDDAVLHRVRHSFVRHSFAAPAPLPACIRIRLRHHESTA